MGYATHCTWSRNGTTGRLSRKSIRRIAGGKSSALMTSRWLAPEIPCCCLSPFIREEGSRLGELFRGIGITSCESEEIP